jgi:ABC-type methionine transport system ATPase subunit
MPPTVGIDPQSRNLIFEVVEKLHKEGMTIVYTTHYMEEAERLCERIGIIDDGDIIAQGTLDELKRLGSRKETLVISFTNLSYERYASIAKYWKDLQRFDNTIHFYFPKTRIVIYRLQKQEGILKKLLCSPMHPKHILYGKLIYANIISIFQLIVMFVYAWLAFGLDIMHYLPSIVLMILVLCLLHLLKQAGRCRAIQL